ncbi:MAG: hypothetical protein EZS28_044266 [Streblomastix strix]|uniref:PSD13 N-terminal domain-containing protein n=1 Tax=Streblomastix strix TaxID=222440 RepID=A0A5J4TNW1_9EUKA|nr:MAG: hypothetical protein EZS28_044266 [Streblomastix strix]
MDISPLQKLKSGKLWLQLLDGLEEFVDRYGANNDLEFIYTTIITGIESNFNRVRFGKIIGSIAKTTSDPVTFLARVRKTYEGRNKQDDLDAYLLITLALIQHLQFTNRRK